MHENRTDCSKMNVKEFSFLFKPSAMYIPDSHLKEFEFRQAPSKFANRPSLLDKLFESFPSHVKPYCNHSNQHRVLPAASPCHWKISPPRKTLSARWREMNLLRGQDLPFPVPKLGEHIVTHCARADILSLVLQSEKCTERQSTYYGQRGLYFP